MVWRRMRIFCISRNTAAVIIATFGLQKVKKSSMSASVDMLSAAAAANPV